MPNDTNDNTQGYTIGGVTGIDTTTFTGGTGRRRTTPPPRLRTHWADTPENAEARRREDLDRRYREAVEATRAPERGGLDMPTREEKVLSPGTFGLEFEINNVNQLCRPLPPGWNYTNDISVQSKATLFRGKPVQSVSDKIKLTGRGKKVGVEIVSPIISKFDDVVTVLDNIKETGIKTKSKDCGIHVHVSFPRGDAIVSLFKLALKYEPLFYAAGTFGGFSRGVYKDYIYQRPLSHPPIVKIAKTNDDLERGRVYYGRAFDHDKFSTVETEEDFAAFISEKTGGKYHGAKYCGLNFYSYFYRSTVEVRTFNLTTNYSYLKAVINMSRDFAFAGINEFYSRKEGDKIEVNFINDMSHDDILALFEEFTERYATFMDKEDIYTIKQIIKNSPKIVIPPDVLFHLIFHRNGDNSRIQTYTKKRFLPDEINIENAIKPVPEQLEDYDFQGDLCAS